MRKKNRHYRAREKRRAPEAQGGTEIESQPTLQGPRLSELNGRGEAEETQRMGRKSYGKKM